MANKIQIRRGAGVPDSTKLPSDGELGYDKTGENLYINKDGTITLVGGTAKLDKVLDSNKIYGTDASGNQTAYDKTEFNGGVLQVADASSLPATGETDFVYLTLDTKTLYTWNETASEYQETDMDGGVWS
jgi:hypothetical protein